MDFEDIVYLFLLIFSIIFGRYYQSIEDIQTKKWIGSLVGFILIFIVSGTHIIHLIITILVNAFIILHHDKRKCHVASFTFTFIYLMFFRMTEYFGIPFPPSHTNMIQMVLTLKLVGLAFEVNSSHTLKTDTNYGDKTDEQNLEDQWNHLDLSFSEIFHYSFNYIGILTGPYIRYKTFRDYFQYPFSGCVDWKKATIQKVKIIPLVAILFLVASHYWPLSYAKTEEFYTDRSFSYRLWYIWPNFFIFRMRLYVGLVLSECVCTVAGFGAYPEFTQPKCGHGPSKNFGELKASLQDMKKLMAVEYNYETIHNVNPERAEFCPTVRETMKHWNMCIQYWLAVNIYKRFPYKRYRTFATMFVSALWHGVYAGYYVCLLGTAVVFPLDVVYTKLLLKDRSGWALRISQWFMVVFKMFFFSYLSTAFNLLTFDWIIHYYNSIYHAGIIIGVVAYFVGLQLLKMRKANEKQEGGTKAEQVPNKME